MIGDRIKILRTFNNMTQDELVNGIASIAYLSKVENGQSKPSEQFLEKLSNKLNIEVELLLNPTFKPETEDHVREICEGYWQKKILSARDISLIKLFSIDLQNNQISLMVFSVLIRFYYSHSRLEEAVDTYNLSKRIVTIDETLSNRNSSFYYLFSCGVLHFELYDFHKANEYFLRAEALLPNKDKEKARLYYNLSLINEKIHSDKTVCLYYSEKAYQFMKKTGERNRTVNILLVRAIQYFIINQWEIALKCVEEAQSLVVLQEADPRLKSSIVYSFGRIYQIKKEYSEAIQFFNEYIRIVESLFPEKVLKGYKRLAEISIHQKEWDNVAVYLEKAQKVATKYKRVFFDKETKLLEITTYKIRQLDDRYEKEMQKLLSYCIEQQDDELSRYLASELGVYYHERQAYKKAATYLKQAYDIEKQQKKDMSHILEGFRFEF